METARARRTAGRSRLGRRPVAERARRTLLLVGAAVALAAVLAEASVTGRAWLPPGAAGWGLLALAAALAVPSVLPGHGTARVTGAVAPLSLAGLLLHGPSAALLLALPLVLAPVVHRGRRLSAVLRAACEVTAVAVAAGAVALAGLLPPGSGPWTPEQWASAAVPALLVGGTAHLVLRGALLSRCLPPTVGPVGPARPAPAAAALLAAAPLIVVVATHAPVLLPLFAPALGALDAALRSARARATDRLLDPLTGLPNRRWLVQRTRDALVEVERTDSRCALVLIDVDRFRSVNDTLGHGTGDRLLLEIAERVERAAPAGAETARLGADEFAVLLPTIPSVGAAHRAAREVVRAIEAPVELDGLTVVVEASAGVAVYPDHAAPRTDGGRGAPAGAPPCPHPPAPARSLTGEAGRPLPAPPEGVTAAPGAPSAEQPSAPLRPRLPVRAAHRGEGSVRDLPTSPAGRRGTTVPPPAAPPACGPASTAEPPGRTDRHPDTPGPHPPPRPTVPPPPTVPPAATRPAPAAPSSAGAEAIPPSAPRDRSSDRAESAVSAATRCAWPPPLGQYLPG
ncbi:GGDEF domain-containing protein, partial [Streptomyces bohaiensis]